MQYITKPNTVRNLRSKQLSS